MTSLTKAEEVFNEDIVEIRDGTHEVLSFYPPPAAAAGLSESSVNGRVQPIFWRLQTFQRFGNRVFSGWGWMNASMLHALPFSSHVTLFHQQIHILTSWVMVKETKNDPLLSFTGRHWRKRWNEEVSKYLYSAPAWSGHLSLLHSEFFSLYFSWT